MSTVRITRRNTNRKITRTMTANKPFKTVEYGYLLSDDESMVDAYQNAKGYKTMSLDGDTIRDLCTRTVIRNPHITGRTVTVAEAEDILNKVSLENPVSYMDKMQGATHCEAVFVRDSIEEVIPIVENLVEITITPEVMNTEHKLYSRLVENLLVKALEYKYGEPERSNMVYSRYVVKESLALDKERVQKLILEQDPEAFETIKASTDGELETRYFIIEDVPLDKRVECPSWAAGYTSEQEALDNLTDENHCIVSMQRRASGAPLASSKVAKMISPSVTVQVPVSGVIKTNTIRDGASAQSGWYLYGYSELGI